MDTSIKRLLEVAGVDITKGKAKELCEGSASKLPTSFKSGDEFMEFVYSNWKSKETHVEHQGRGHWSAEIAGAGKIKGANYDEKSKNVSWLDAELEELKENETTMGVLLPDTNGNIELTDIHTVKELTDLVSGLSSAQQDALDYFFSLDGDSISSIVMNKPKSGKTKKMKFKSLVKWAIDEQTPGDKRSRQ